MARATMLDDAGNKLRKLLVAAAGLEGKAVCKLVVTLERNAYVKFEATIAGDQDDIQQAFTRHGDGTLQPVTEQVCTTEMP